jgi:hypothetical protein
MIAISDKYAAKLKAEFGERFGQLSRRENGRWFVDHQSLKPPLPRHSHAAPPQPVQPTQQPPFVAERLGVCLACPHCLSGERCGVLVKRGKGAWLMNPKGVPNPAARCPDEPRRWEAEG